jgi:hypothetical protein
MMMTGFFSDRDYRISGIHSLPSTWNYYYSDEGFIGHAIHLLIIENEGDTISHIMKCDLGPIHGVWYEGEWF